MIQYVGYLMMAKMALDGIGGYMQSEAAERRAKQQAMLYRKHADKRYNLALENAEQTEQVGEEQARLFERQGGLALTYEANKAQQKVSDIVSRSGSSGAVVGYGAPRSLAMTQALANKFNQDVMRENINARAMNARVTASRNARAIRRNAEAEREYYYDMASMQNSAANNIARMRPLTLLTGFADTGSQMLSMDYSSRVRTGGGDPSKGSGMSYFDSLYTS